MLARRRLYHWQFLTLDGASVTSSSGLPVLPDARLADHPGGDMLFVLPSYDHLRHVTPETTRALRAASRRFSLLAGMDTGSWILAEAGLLDGYQATIHWDEIDEFLEQFPEITTLDARIVIDRDRASCGGAMTAFDLVQELIEKAHGPALRLEISSLFMHGEPAGGGAAPTGSSLVDAAVALMRRNLETPLLIPAVARSLGCTQRSLETRFKHKLGHGPRHIYRRLRLLAARRMLEQTGRSIAEISVCSGYVDASAMTRAYGQEFGETPSTTRMAFQLGRTTPVTGANRSSPK